MPRTIPYDATNASLFYPMSRPTLLQPGGVYSEAHLAVECARLVYTPFEKDLSVRTQLLSTLTQLGFADIAFHVGPHSDAQAITMAYPGQNLLFLTIRGTEVNFKDYKTSFIDWSLKRWDGAGNVHHGFAGSLASIWQSIETWFDARHGTRLYTGHSMGAAMATLAASLRNPDRVYSFGSPRVGDNDFVHSLAGVDIRRYVHCADLVPHVPLREMRFVHVGRLHYLNRDSQLILDANDDVQDRDTRRANWSYAFNYAWRPGNAWLRQLADHTPINYSSAILGIP